MRDKKRFLPQGWLLRALAAAAAAIAGNFLMAAIPWPGHVLSSYEDAMSPALARSAAFLLETLVLAPLLEEGVFRLALYGWLRRLMGVWPAALLSSLAFGMYHGNWIQGTYAFCLGMVLALGYESSERRGYPMAVLMHGTANLAALLAFGV